MIIKTNRLILVPIQLSDSLFLLDLVNTEGWLKFIGDKNIKTQKSAEAYIQNIIENPIAEYWTVKLFNNNKTIGILTFFKRSYLEFHDFGFAFLPEFTKKGYAFEASAKLLDELKKGRNKIQAITINDNFNSIRLLERLGFKFESIINNDIDTLLVYGLSIL